MPLLLVVATMAALLLPPPSVDASFAIPHPSRAKTRSAAASHRPPFPPHPPPPNNGPRRAHRRRWAAAPAAPATAMPMSSSWNDFAYDDEDDVLLSDLPPAVDAGFVPADENDDPSVKAAAGAALMPPGVDYTGPVIEVPQGEFRANESDRRRRGTNRRPRAKYLSDIRL